MWFCLTGNVKLSSKNLKVQIARQVTGQTSADDPKGRCLSAQIQTALLSVNINTQQKACAQHC